VKDFFPIEGTRKTFREVAALYRAFGHGNRIALAEGVHGHMYSPENRRAAFAFIDRFSGMPARTTLDPIKVLDAPALRVTPTGQVRVDLAGRSLPEVIREEFGARVPPPSKRTLADLYRDGAALVARAESAGTSKIGDARVDRYRLSHGEHLVIPLLHIHRETPARGRAVVVLAWEGKVGAGDWPSVRRRLDAGEEVLSFDLRGVGENGMRYRAASGDDPTLAEADEARAYFNPLSGVLANHVYNSLLTGRPYFLEAIEDVEIVSRFAREKLGRAKLVLAPSASARGLADAAAKVLPGLEIEPAADLPPFVWADVVEQMRETWPIQYLLPGAATFDR
jgi:hypothetical protein